MRLITSSLKNIFWFGFDLLLWLELWLHERILRSLRPHRTALSEMVLKRFLVADHRTRSKAIANYGMPLFDGLHPKNVFNFRYQFFLESVTAADVVLDVACGSGLLLHKLSGAIKQGIGVELSETQLAICRTQHADSNLSFIGADIFKFDYNGLYRTHPVTVALFSHILEHIEDVPALLKLVGAPKLLICVPSQEDWLTQLKIHFGLPYHTDATHYREYTREMLTAELVQAGYQVTYIGFNSEGEIICRAQR